MACGSSLRSPEVDTEALGLLLRCDVNAGRINIAKRTIRGLALLAFSLVACAATSRGVPTSRVSIAFLKLQSLVGEWEGKDGHGMPVRTHFVLIASKTAVMETLRMSDMEEMVTLYSVDGDAISLLHYCPTNNHPHMRATPPSGDIRELVFTFQGAENLPNLASGHEHKLVIQFEDKDHITERWTWRKNGHDTAMIYRFERQGRETD
jgi:hypothetical protein